MKNWEKLKQNPKLWEVFKIRMQIIKAIREFFWKKGFLEVETPLMVSSLILESSLDHFQTELTNHIGKSKKMFLTTSPEASLKKLLYAGSGNIFEITKSFRNCEDGIGNHNSEFTILEWYEVGRTYKEVMKTCEELMQYIKSEIRNPPPTSRLRRTGKCETNSKFKFSNGKIIYQDKNINIRLPWNRISMLEAWEKYVKIPYDELYNEKTKSYPLEKIIKVSQKLGYTVDKKNTWEEIFNQIFLNEIEPKLIQDGQPFFLYDYPTSLAALATIKKEDPRFAERFELYIGGLEIADCYGELTDYQEQKIRFEIEKQIIKKMGKKDFIEDQDFLKALKMGLPKCSGCALGIDRLVMIFTNSKSIEEVILFPNSQI